MFTGITQEAMWLLAENRFNDSKVFYEEHKPQIREGVLLPLRELVAELADTVQEIDPKILVNPNSNGTISRVRRDNRYTRDKSMYRENMWIGFLRDKKAYDCAPGFFIDFSLRGSTYGVGYYWSPPRLMQQLRLSIDEKPAAWAQAAQAAVDAGFEIVGDRYARPKKIGLPPLLDELANRKSIGFEKFEPDPSFFGSVALVDALKQAFRTLAPAYRRMVEVTEQELLSRMENGVSRESDPI